MEFNYKLKVGNAMKKLSILLLSAVLLISGCANTAQSSYKYDSTERYTVKLSVGNKEIAKENEAALNVSVEDMPDETSEKYNTQTNTSSSQYTSYTETEQNIRSYWKDSKLYKFSGNKLVMYQFPRWGYSGSNIENELKKEELQAIADDIAKNYIVDIENYTCEIDDFDLEYGRYHFIYNRKSNGIKLVDQFRVILFKDGIISLIDAYSAGAFYGVDVPEFDKDDYIAKAKSEYDNINEDCFSVKSESLKIKYNAVYYCVSFTISKYDGLKEKEYKICDVK